MKQLPSGGATGYGRPMPCRNATNNNRNNLRANNRARAMRLCD
jgi:hypothetical protein